MKKGTVWLLVVGSLIALAFIRPLYRMVTDQCTSVYAQYASNVGNPQVYVGFIRTD